MIIIIMISSILVFGLIMLNIGISIKFGKLIGNSVTKVAGLVLGVIFIILGVTLIIISIYNIINNLYNIDYNINMILILSVVFIAFMLGSALFIIGLLSIIYSNNMEKNLNGDTNIKEGINPKYEIFIGKNIEDILNENNLGEYIDLFVKNKITDLKLISNLNELDFEKLGINILGDRKKIMMIFSKE